MIKSEILNCWKAQKQIEVKKIITVKIVVKKPVLIDLKQGYWL